MVLPWECRWGPSWHSALWAPHPLAIRASPFHSPQIKAADSGRLSALDKEGIYGFGVGFFRSVLLVARTFDFQITAWAHLCRLCSLRRSLTPDSCVGRLPKPNAWISPLCTLAGGAFGVQLLARPCLT